MSEPPANNPYESPEERVRSDERGQKYFRRVLLGVAVLTILVIAGAMTYERWWPEGWTPGQSATAEAPPMIATFEPPDPADVRLAQENLDELASTYGPDWKSQLSAAVTFLCHVGALQYYDQSYAIAAYDTAADYYRAYWRYESGSGWSRSFDVEYVEATQEMDCMGPGPRQPNQGGGGD